MEEAERDHWTELKAEGGIAATYNRDGVGTAITVVPGGREHEEQNVEGLIVGKKNADFIVEVDEMKTAGLFPPRRRDRITVEVNSVFRRFDVAATAGEQPFTAMGNYGIIVRIHTKEFTN